MTVPGSSVGTAEEALRHMFLLIDEGRHADFVATLAEEVAFADEITPSWLRGRAPVTASFGLLGDVVADVVSTISNVASTVLSGGEVMLTFDVRQKYRFDGTLRDQESTACATLRRAGDEWQLLLLHFGNLTLRELEPRRDDLAPLRAHSLGERIRELRNSHGLSIRGLSARSGLSPSFLSQLERSQVDVSVGSLRRIAIALGTGPAQLLLEVAGPGSQPTRPTRSWELGVAHLDELGIKVEPLPRVPGAAFDAWITELNPDAPALKPRSVGGARLICVLDGHLEIQGAEPVTLYPRDSVSLGPGPYQLRAVGGGAVRFICVQQSRVLRPRRAEPGNVD